LLSSLHLVKKNSVRKKEKGRKIEMSQNQPEVERERKSQLFNFV